tara:strand:- start:54 stop:335 length:282 start_codon:yes stop_codon:yes gene_type:complete
MKATQQIGMGEPAILEKTYDENNPEASEMTNLESRQLEKRAERNNLLALSDSKVLPDRGLSESKVTEWKTYRKSLRDTDFSDPNDITWPAKPE